MVFGCYCCRCLLFVGLVLVFGVAFYCGCGWFGWMIEVVIFVNLTSFVWFWLDLTLFGFGGTFCFLIFKLFLCLVCGCFGCGIGLIFGFCGLLADFRLIV